MSKRALLVGIDIYPYPANNLNSCVNDTAEFQSMLTSTYGFKAADITVLHDQDATYGNVTEALDALLFGADSGDQLVYFQSSHGWRHQQGDTMVEELVLYGGFLPDTELVTRTQTVPPGVLTVVVDTCHSGGMDKAFFPDGEFALARTKVYQPSPQELANQDKAFDQVTKFKFFGRKPTANAGTIIGNFGPTAQKAFTIPASKDAGDLEINATLFAACTAEQTAAAGSPATKWLSAFTFGLTSALDPGVSLHDQWDMVVDRLDALNMSQTPMYFVPTAHPEFAGQTFITRQPPTAGPGSKDFQPDIGTAISDVITSLKRSGGNPATAHSQGGKTMTATNTDATTAAIQKVLSSLNGDKAKAFGLSPWSVLSSPLITDCFGTVQAVLDTNPEVKAKAAASKAPPAKSSLGVADYASKDTWDAISYGLCAPIYAVRERTTKAAAPAVPAAPDPKLWGFLASALSVVGPMIYDAIKGQQFDPANVVVPEIPPGVDKGWLDSAFDLLVDHAVPAFLDYIEDEL
jgi:Caspase domain